MDDLLTHAGYQIHRPQLRPMAASKSNGPRSPVDVIPRSNSKPTSTTPNNDDGWDWDGYGLGPTNPQPSSADVTVDPIFGSFDHRRNGSNSSSADVAVDSIFGAFDHRHNGSNSKSPPADIGTVDPIFGSFDRRSGSKNSDFGDFDLMSAGVGGDVFENFGKVREEKVGGKDVGGFDELIPGFGISEPSFTGSGGNDLENLGRKVSEKGGGGGRMDDVNSGFDELIPGLGGSNSNRGRKFSESYSPRETTSSNTNGITVEDPLVNFESASAPPSSSSGLFTDLLNDSPVSANSGRPIVDFPTSRPISLFDGVQDPTSFFPNEINVTEMKNKTNPGNNASERRPSNQSSTMNFLDDLNFNLGEFQEADSKSEERGKNKIERDLETRIRVAKALDDKKQRDMQIQREQDEKHRIAEKLDFDIKRWSAGKEGNLRALLSSLQGILDPECGWQPVSLTDLITAQAVKKVYKKATLYIHPDKMQQRGATLHQKFVAEKVFDIIKEAYKKFESEELF